MRNDYPEKAVFVIILLLLITAVMFGEDIMAAITKEMSAQTGSMLERLLR